MFDDTPMLDINLDNPLPEKKVLEKDIENAVCQYAVNECGMMAEKFTSPGRRSVPDRLFTTAGGFMFFIEFKAPGKKATKKQVLDHERRRQKGCMVFVCDDKIEGKVIISRMYNHARANLERHSKYDI